VFELLSKAPTATQCPGVEGFLEEKQAFAGTQPTAEIHDLYNLNAGARTERYEISVYEGLIAMAQQMRLREVEQYLKQNLSEEEHALSTIRHLLRIVLQQKSLASSY
jgi:ferritin-like metal-binding protein YciE